MIDSNDRSRIEEAKNELHRIILDREMKEALLLVFANKQDIQGGELECVCLRLWLFAVVGGCEEDFSFNFWRGKMRANRGAAMTPTEVQEKLQLNKLKDKIWYVVPSCATTGEGLFEGLVSHMTINDLERLC